MAPPPKSSEKEAQVQDGMAISGARSAFESSHHVVEAIYLNTVFPAENVRSALSYEPREGDVFIVSYPKCGTTWLHHIVLNILSGGTLSPSMLERQRKDAFLEFAGAEGILNSGSSTPIITHLPPHKAPHSANAKYIYVTRNPYDCCVSYYYHVKGFPWYHFADGTFSEFFDMFVSGKVDYGDYFDHLLPWYERRHDPNVLFITYESVKEDTDTWVLRIADFLDKQQYGDFLKTRPDVLEKVLNAVSIDTMKKLTFSIGDEAEQAGAVCADATGDLSVATQNPSKRASRQDQTTGLVSGTLARKGIVGDWKNHFSPGQITEMNAWVEEKTRGSDVMGLWKNNGLP
ncbi:sulfotransferase ssu-1-like [Haemaphysalis longicornis]